MCIGRMWTAGVAEHFADEIIWTKMLGSDGKLVKFALWVAL